MPTGAGKTITAREVAGSDALWMVHRRELAAQAPGRAVTIQSLLQADDLPPAKLLVCDEAHHMAPSARRWHAIASRYPRILGLTATPQRGDGSPLGDLFERIVVGAHYSELIDAGHLVPAQVYRPPETIQGVAIPPADAWNRYADGRQGFAYFARVDHARRFRDAVDGCEIITGTTPTDERDDTLARFRRGEVQCLSNVQVLTEGVDVPEAGVCLIARGCEHHGTYLQMVGRVLRPAPGKDHATVIDLGGVSHLHGLPHDDREYSLAGTAIKVKPKVEALRVCLECGRTQPSGPPACAGCGFVFPVVVPRVRIWDIPLSLAREVAVTPAEILAVEKRERLASHSEEKRRERYRELVAFGRERGYKPNWAAVQYKIRYKEWPRWR